MKIVMLVGAAALLAAPGIAQQPAAAPAVRGYHVARKIPVGGEGGWDYLTVDTIGHRLYLSRGTHVIVINTDNDGVAGDIPGQAGVHGIAIAPDLGRGFISNGREKLDRRDLRPQDARGVAAREREGPEIRTRSCTSRE